MEYFNIYKDVWEFHKRYCKTQDSEAFWNEVITESSKIYEKYNKSKFVKGLLVAVLVELNRSFKENGADANKGV